VAVGKWESRVLCGISRCGTVFKLVPQTGGRYERLTIHVFSAAGTGAWNPQSGLTLDASGNLYGTTLDGGPENAGTLFKLAPTSGPWTFSVLHSFGANATDGSSPAATVTVDAAGNIYGTTPTGRAGKAKEGIVYRLSPKTGGGYTYSILHSFGAASDGATPRGPLVFDAAGNLYGTALGGGSNEKGAVFELSPVLGGGWTESVIYNFATAVGNAPSPYLAIDGSGNLYGTAAGGTGNGGVAYEVSKSGATWTAQVLYNFCAVHGCPEGFAPSGFIFDGAGNLYGVATSGGTYQSGTLVELSPATGGTWTATLPHTFGKGKDGADPAGTLLYLGGDLFGSTTLGGEYGSGTVFQVTP
jgi:uncharacterized repeat protein (TIGR03803 family)